MSLFKYHPVNILQFVVVNEYGHILTYTAANTPEEAAAKKEANGGTPAKDCACTIVKLILKIVGGATHGGPWRKDPEVIQ